jgi:cyanate lyase
MLAAHQSSRWRELASAVEPPYDWPNYPGLGFSWDRSKLMTMGPEPVLAEITQTVLRAKSVKQLTFADLAQIIGCDPVFLAAVCYRQASASDEQAIKLLDALGLDHSLALDLVKCPVKGGLMPAVPVDPLLYRFYEIMQVYGLPLKDVIQEMFGDGIMSAIDFSMHVEKQADPKGERVKITMSGKFLPYKKW